MNEQPVTIREHLSAALLAAGPVGLTMVALVEAVAGTWSPRDVQDTVRRLWQVGELARRQDGTFVLGERAAKTTSRATGNSTVRSGGSPSAPGEPGMRASSGCGASTRGCSAPSARAAASW